MHAKRLLVALEDNIYKFENNRTSYQSEEHPKFTVIFVKTIGEAEILIIFYMTNTIKYAIY